MPLSIEEREQFLAEPHVAALSVVAGSDRGPLTVPIWYDYVPGGLAWVLTPPDSRKAKLITDAGRFTLLVQRTAPTTRYVSMEGPVVDIGPSTEDEVRLMARRYLPSDRVEPMSSLRGRSTGFGWHLNAGFRPTWDRRLKLPLRGSSSGDDAGS